jgi:hypothetical protein
MLLNIVYQNIHKARECEYKLLPVAGFYLLQETFGGWRCFVGSAGIGILYVGLLWSVQSFLLCLY